MSPRKKTKLERLLSFNQHRRRFGGSQNFSRIEDLTTRRNSIIQGTKKTYTHGSSKNLSEHLESLKDEFVGDSELCYVVAKTIVLIRRESKIKDNACTPYLEVQIIQFESISLFCCISFSKIISKSGKNLKNFLLSPSL